jgi:hypothetical protein
MLDEEEFYLRNQNKSLNLGRGSHVYYDDESADAAYKVISIEKPVHCMKTKELNPVISKYFDENMEELLKIGYEPGQFAIPDINAKTEKESLKNHLQLFHERKPKITLTESEKERVINLCLHRLSANKYDMPLNYKTKENIEDVINSSLIKANKSPGYPYSADGIMTNGQVFKVYGDTFPEVVLQNWNTPFDIKHFLKHEFNKIKKIEKGMPRGVNGLPIHKTVKHQCIFRNMTRSFKENWMESPVVYSYNPLKPGHIKTLAKAFEGPGIIATNDQINWDMAKQEQTWEIETEIFKRLAVIPNEASDKDVQDYYRDVEEAQREMYVNARYRCTDGTVYQATRNGRVVSGFLLTIDGNSVDQIIVDVSVLVKMGLSDEDILDVVIKVGGDDVVTKFKKEIDLVKYVEIANSLGYALGPFETHENFNNVEFFSARLYKQDGIWAFRPVRITKHLENIKLATMDNLAMTLASHMTNHMWDGGRYKFFYKMYQHFRKEHPSLFPVKLLKSQKELQFRANGYENEADDDYDCEAWDRIYGENEEGE